MSRHFGWAQVLSQSVYDLEGDAAVGRAGPSIMSDKDSANGVALLTGYANRQRTVPFANAPCRPQSGDQSSTSETVRMLARSFGK